MSRLDPDVLYLVLTKVAAQESFYNYDPKNLEPGQLAGTITTRQLSDVIERVTGNRPGASLAWARQTEQLDALLGKCGLPSLGVVLASGGAAVDAEKLALAQKTKWPPFSALKGLYRK